MPKVLIREIDLTEPGRVPYANFSVLVPGTIAADKSADEFENGIIEFEKFNTAKFVETVGTVDSEYVAKNIPAKPTVIDDEATGIDAYKLDVKTYYQCIDNGEVYKVEEVSEIAEPGKLQFNVTEGEGETKTTVTYACEKVTDGDPVENETYVRIAVDKVGADAATTLGCVGNQIAYNLISLGYDVMYKIVKTGEEIEAEYNPSQDEFWAPLADKAVYDFRYIVSGYVEGDALAAVRPQMVKLAASRGDCIALLDVNSTAYAGRKIKDAIEAIKADAVNGNEYSAFFAPFVVYRNINPGVYENNMLPASFHYLACAAEAAKRYPEWFAIAGYTRGICNLGIERIGYKFGDASISALQPRKGNNGAAVNVIATIRNSYYLWGNRTAKTLAEELVANHFLNIRQLCCTLKKELYKVCRELTFEPNSDMLWLNFCNRIMPTLERMKNNQGIKDFRLEKKHTDLKAKLFAAVRIIPIEAVEDFEIVVTMEDNFENPTISLTEELGSYDK